MFCALLTSRYQVSVYRTNGPLVISTILVRVIFLIVTLLNNVKVDELFHFQVSKSEKNYKINKHE